MDKYEFNIKVEQIKKLMAKGDFTTSMKIADTIDWRRVRNVNLLGMFAQVYEKNGEYQEAKEIFVQAYERAPVSKRILNKLVELSLREGNIREAEGYYREFSEAAPGDVRQSLLRYLILKAKGAPVNQKISALEKYVESELDEKWMYELAELYASAGDRRRCIQMCDKITLMFAFGKYVDKALELKAGYTTLSDYQKDLVQNPDKYEAQYKAVEQEFSNGALNVFGSDDQNPDAARYADESFNMQMQFPDHDYNGAQYNGMQYDDGRYADGGSYADSASYAADGSYADGNSYVADGSYANGNSYAADGSYADGSSYAADGSYADGASYAADGSYADGSSYSQDSYEGQQPDDRSAEAFENEAAPDPYNMDRTTLDEELMANLRQAAEEEKLAKEMSRLAEDGYAEEVMKEHTKKLYDIRRALPKAVLQENQEAQVVDDEHPEEGMTQPEPSGDAAEEETGEAAPEASGENGDAAPEKEMTAQNVSEEPAARFMTIETRTPEKGLEKAIERLRAYHVQNNSHNQTIKIAGSKLNSRGVEAVADRLAGKDLIIDEAGDLSGDELAKLEHLMEEDQSGMVVVLLDNPLQMEEMYQKYPEQLQLFERIDGEKVAEEVLIGEAVMQQVEEQERLARQEEEIPAGEEALPQEEAEAQPEYEEEAQEPEISQDSHSGQEMDADSFAEYACQYAAQIDCSITGKSMLALYERVELMEEDGIPLTPENAEAMIEEAADKAEKPSFGRLITGIFSAKYNKEGLLILREEHFI